MKIAIHILRAVDRLYDIKNEIKVLENERKELSSLIKTHMEENDLDSIQGNIAEAIYEIREYRKINPGAYLEALNGDTDKFFNTVSIRIDSTKDKPGAKTYLGDEDLDSICDGIEEVGVLRLKKLKQTPTKIVVEKPQPFRRRRA